MNKHTARILLVEDNDLDVEKIERGFKCLKIPNEIERAENGLVALDIMRGDNGHKKIMQPYFVLLDINMPKMNGLEFLEAVRSDQYLSSTPVFVLTTSDSRKDIEVAYQYNVNGYIVKPVKIEEMREALRTLHSFWNLVVLPSEKTCR